MISIYDWSKISLTGPKIYGLSLLTRLIFWTFEGQKVFKNYTTLSIYSIKCTCIQTIFQHTQDSTRWYDPNIESPSIAIKFQLFFGLKLPTPFCHITVYIILPLYPLFFCKLNGLVGASPLRLQANTRLRLAFYIISDKASCSCFKYYMVVALPSATLIPSSVFLFLF